MLIGNHPQCVLLMHIQMNWYFLANYLCLHLFCKAFAKCKCGFQTSKLTFFKRNQRTNGCRYLKRNLTALRSFWRIETIQKKNVPAPFSD